MQASAVPEVLRDFRRQCRELDRELAVAIGVLVRALDELRRGPTTVTPAVPAVDHDVVRWQGEARRLADWVGQVGDAFAAADASPHRPGPVAVADESHLVVGRSPAELRPPPLAGLLALLDLDRSPWIDARFPALAARRRGAHERLAGYRDRIREAAVADYVGTPLASDRLRPAVRDLADDVAVAVGEARATPAEVAAYLAVLDRRAVLALALALGQALRRASAHLRPADRRYLRRALAPLRLRIDQEWPAESFTRPCATERPRPDRLDAARRALEVPDPPRRTASFPEGVVNGLVLGAADEEGYDNGWGEAGRVIGQVVSGLLLYGDVRDGVVHASRGQWPEAAVDAAGVVPVAGDALKAARAGGRLADGTRQASRVEEVIGDIGRLDRLHAERLANRGDLVQRARLARRAGDDGARLEAHVALLVGNDLVSFQRKVHGAGGVAGEIDVETSRALIEVTFKDNGKLHQLVKLVEDPNLNPLQKPVVLFAPSYTRGAARAVEALGVTVTRTERELMAVLGMLPPKGP